VRASTFCGLLVMVNPPDGGRMKLAPEAPAKDG
jgi:hypothetical protein